MKMELRNPIIQLEDSRESLTSIMNQTEARMSGHVHKVEDLDQIKNMRKLKTQERNIEEMWDSIKKLNFQTIVIDEGEQLQVNGIDQIFSKNTEETSPNQEKPYIYKYKNHRELQLDKRQRKKNSPWNFTVKTLSMHNTTKK